MGEWVNGVRLFGENEDDSMDQTQNGKRQRSRRTTGGIALGAGIGMIIGAAFGQVAAGMVFGAALGSAGAFAAMLGHNFTS